MSIEQHIKDEISDMNIPYTDELFNLVVNEIKENTHLFIRKCEGIVGFNSENLEVDDWIMYENEPYKVISTSVSLARIQSIITPSKQTNIYIKSPVGIIKRKNETNQNNEQ